MEKRGEITVFLTLIFLSICSLLCGLAESARTAGARYYARQALNAAADSLMAQYHRGLWENYRIFGLEYRGRGRQSGADSAGGGAGQECSAGFLCLPGAG